MTYDLGWQTYLFLYLSCNVGSVNLQLCTNMHQCNWDMKVELYFQLYVIAPVGGDTSDWRKYLKLEVLLSVGCITSNWRYYPIELFFRTISTDHNLWLHQEKRPTFLFQTWLFTQQKIIILVLSFPPVSPARVDDEWHKIRKCRKYLIKEMDAIRMMPSLSGKQVLFTIAISIWQKAVQCCCFHAIQAAKESSCGYL